MARYTVNGDLFCASSNDLYIRFECAEDPQRIVIHLSGSHLWDASTTAPLDSVEVKYRHYGKHVEVTGLTITRLAMRAHMTGHPGNEH